MIATYTLEGRYGYGAWTWLVLRHANDTKPETVGAYTDVAQAQAVVVQCMEAEQRATDRQEKPRMRRGARFGQSKAAEERPGPLTSYSRVDRWSIGIRCWVAVGVFLCAKATDQDNLGGEFNGQRC